MFLKFSLTPPIRRPVVARLAALLIAVAAAACSSPAPVERPAGTATPVYDQNTGRLEQLVSDRDGDGKPDTWAFMNGARIDRIEIDTDGDGKRDRIEVYGPPSAARGQGLAADPPLVRVDLAKGATDRITRREFFDGSALTRVEEDTDDDGRVDKWEEYVNGALQRMDLDVTGRGKADRRLIYGSDGSVLRIEADPDGDGQFAPVPSAARGGSR